MNIETIKTFILVILIGISLLLSVVIWNYQPNLDPIQSNYVSEVDIGGDEVMKRDVVQPTSLLFHVRGEAYSYRNDGQRQSVYENMQNWLFSDMEMTRPPDIHNENKSIELSFPLAIPSEMIPNIFNLDNDNELPNWSFDKMVITFNDSFSTLNIYFLSKSSENAARFVVSESDAYTYLSTIIRNIHRLTQYSPFGPEEEPIYIPTDSVEMKRRSIAIEEIDPSLLVNALFPNPSIVSVGESNYNDGQRGMTVLNDGRSMEFINPIQADDQTDFIDLMNLSINDINEHKGWTNDYILTEINYRENRLQYQMYYEGYPVFSHRDYSMIEQQWHSQDLHQYKRPLFKLTNLLNSESVTLPSGEEVIKYISESSNYQMENITDIQLGYRLKYGDASFSVVLDPTWYIYYNERWIELRMSVSEKILGNGGA